MINPLTIDIFRQIYPDPKENTEPFTFEKEQFLFLEIKNSFFVKQGSSLKVAIKDTIQKFQKNLRNFFIPTMEFTAKHTYILLLNGLDPAGNIQIISEILEEVKNEKSHNWFYDFKVFWFNGAGASFVAEEKERDQ